MTLAHLFMLSCFFASFYLSVCHEAENPLSGGHGVPAHEHKIPHKDPQIQVNQQEHQGQEDQPTIHAENVIFDETVIHNKALVSLLTFHARIR